MVFISYLVFNTIYVIDIKLNMTYIRGDEKKILYDIAIRIKDKIKNKVNPYKIIFISFFLMYTLLYYIVFYQKTMPNESYFLSEFYLSILIAVFFVSVIDSYQ